MNQSGNYPRGYFDFVLQDKCPFPLFGDWITKGYTTLNIYEAQTEYERQENQAEIEWNKNRQQRYISWHNDFGSRGSEKMQRELEESRRLDANRRQNMALIPKLQLQNKLLQEQVYELQKQVYQLQLQIKELLKTRQP